MPTFFITLADFASAFVRGLKDPEFRAIFISLISLLLSASIFYWLVEGWGIVDSIYFSVMTLSTVGYGDLHPTTQLSKIFTIVFLLMGTSVFVGFVAKVGSQRGTYFHRHGHKSEKNPPAE